MIKKKIKKILVYFIGENIFYEVKAKIGFLIQSNILFDNTLSKKDFCNGYLMRDSIIWGFSISKIKNKS